MYVGRKYSIASRVNDTLHSSASSVDEAGAGITHTASEAIDAVPCTFGQVGGGCALDRFAERT